MNLKVKLDPGAYMPERAHTTDAGLDLRAQHGTLIKKGDSALFNTGVHIGLARGYYGKVESKSGLNCKYGVVSCGGVIDEGYTGAIAVKLYNLSDGDYYVSRGDKIAQLIIQPYATPDIETVDELENTPRGDNGFGSTGK